MPRKGERREKKKGLIECQERKGGGGPRAGGGLLRWGEGRNSIEVRKRGGIE